MWPGVSSLIQFNITESTYIYVLLFYICRSQWQCGLRHELSSLARMLGSWVRIPLDAWMSVCVFILCVGSGLATGWFLVQGVLLCIGLRNWSETKRFADALCSKVGATQERERERFSICSKVLQFRVTQFLNLFCGWLLLIHGLTILKPICTCNRPYNVCTQMKPTHYLILATRWPQLCTKFVCTVHIRTLDWKMTWPIYLQQISTADIIKKVKLYLCLTN
jgi:hypothetical protein